MAQVPEGLLEELRGRLEELAAETSDRSGSLEAVTVAVEGLTLTLSSLEVDAVQLAVLDPDLATADPVSALVAAAVGLRLATELDLVRHRVGDPSAAAALARADELGRGVHDALLRVASDFADAAETEAGDRVAVAASALADSLARARRITGRGATAPAASRDQAGEDEPEPARRRWWPWSRP